MSRLITIIMITLSIFTLSMLSIFHVKALKNDMEIITNQAIISCENENKSDFIGQIKELSALWEGKQLILNLYIRHDELDKIEIVLAQLNSLKSDFNAKLGIKALYELNFLIAHIYEQELPTAKNLF